jgi:hypothetical protein
MRPRMNRMAKLNLKTIELIQSQKVISAFKTSTVAAYNRAGIS